jgi:hypothetical protein
MALDPAWDWECHERNRIEYLALSRLTKTQGRLPTCPGLGGGPKEVPEPRMEMCLSYPPQTGRQRAGVYHGAVRQRASREDGVHQQTKTKRTCRRVSASRPQTRPHNILVTSRSYTTSRTPWKHVSPFPLYL